MNDSQIKLATIAYADQCQAYSLDADRGPTPPAPPFVGMGAEALAPIVRGLAIIIEQARTGSTEPTPQSFEDAGRLLDCIDHETGEIDGQAYEALKDELGLR